MGKGRLEAFSDGVIAIIITIMVLELRPPHEPSLHALREVVPTFLSYLLSYLFVGIYWNNHHHLLQAVHRVNGAVLWANLHLLLWLSLIPFVTHWMGETHFAPPAVALYGVVLLFAGVAYFVLSRALVGLHGEGSTIATALGSDIKGRTSLIIYAAAIPIAFAVPWMACALYVLVAIMWLVPDRRIEQAVKHAPS